MVISSGEVYGVTFEVDAPDTDPWEYHVTGPPDYDPQVVVSMPVGDTAAALCSEQTAEQDVTY